MDKDKIEAESFDEYRAKVKEMVAEANKPKVKIVKNVSVI